MVLTHGQIIVSSIKTKTSSNGGGSSIRFLASFVATLSTIIECSSSYPGTTTLAIDLFTCMWKCIIPLNNKQQIC